jgi:hypothetical protein
MSRWFALVIVAVGGLALTRQVQAPPSWTWALDTPAQHVSATDRVPDGSFGFVAMAPGWHVTMGPGGLLYDPRQTLTGRFVIESRQVLFPGTDSSEYGVFVGGRDLAGAARAWTAFVLRRDGAAAVLRHTGGRTEVVMPWTRHAAIKPHPGGDETVTNVLRVVQDTAVWFRVNDSVVATFPRVQLPTEGMLGFRIGRALNMHITSLDVTHKLAPAR